MENPIQLNKDIQSKEEQSIESIPILSDGDGLERRKANTQSAVEAYREVIKDNIEYDYLCSCSEIDLEELDGIVDLLLETICSSREMIRIAGNDFPAELVKAKLLKLNSEHIKFVMNRLKENPTRIRNIKKYLQAMLFNAPSTMSGYYTNQVAYDMSKG